MQLKDLGPRALLTAALIAAAALVAAQGTTAVVLLGTAAYTECQTQGRAVRLGKGAPTLLPAHPAAESLRAAIASENPPVLVETAFILLRKAPASEAALQSELASIYGLLRSIGSLEGIEYYSASRKKMRTFYSKSYLIDDPKKKAKLADPVAPAAGSIPSAESLFAFQEDLTFGANTYRYDYESAPGAVSVTATNLTRMSYGIIPVMAPEALKTRLFIIQAEDAILFYAASGAEAPGMFKGKLEDSFSNRAEALFKWFESKATAFIAR